MLIDFDREVDGGMEESCMDDLITAVEDMGAIAFITQKVCSEEDLEDFT
jgi:hypothetical protein